jgi:lysophospholipase L1-like esterase
MASTISIACAGDSITQLSAYPSDLLALLSGGGGFWSVGNYGVAGTCLLTAGDSPYINTGAYTSSKNALPKGVVILLGTNDSKAANWAVSTNFVANYQSLIDAYTGIASHPKVVVCTPPPAATNSLGIQETIISGNIYPLITQQVVPSRSVALADLFSAFGGNDVDPTLLSSDGVHPSAKGAQVIANTVYAAIQTLSLGPPAHSLTQASR